MDKESKIEYVGKCLLITSKKERVLAIGDLHLGYEEALNKSGIMVSRQMFKEIIGELDKVFAKIGRTRIGSNDALSGEKIVGERGEEEYGKRGKIVDKVVLLGDVKHNFGKILNQEWDDVLGLFDYLSKKCNKIVLIKGNHDIILKPIAKKRKLKVVDYWKWKEFCFLHGDENYENIWKDKSIECLVVGHGHPAVRLREGARSEKYKCFLIGKFRGKNMIIVPSFSEWYAGSDPRGGEVVLAWNINFNNFDVKVIGDKMEILKFGKLGKIK